MEVEFTEKEKIALAVMIANFKNTLTVIEDYNKLGGFCEFSSNDLYNLAEKLGVDYWSML